MPVSGPEKERRGRRVRRADYEVELGRLQVELVRMQEWVRAEGARLVVVFEGRDAAGKGGVIKRVTEHLNPRLARIVALPKPTDRQRGQWYFQRYTEQLPDRRRDRTVRPELVQPGGCRARHGLLYS